MGLQVVAEGIPTMVIGVPLRYMHTPVELVAMKDITRVGHLLVNGMPKLLTALGIIGTIAMLWVGGHILLVGADDLGWHAPYALVHHAEEWVAHATGAFGGFPGVALNTFFSFLIGLTAGAVVVAVAHLVRRLRPSAPH